VLAGRLFGEPPAGWRKPVGQIAVKLHLEDVNYQGHARYTYAWRDPNAIGPAAMPGRFVMKGRVDQTSTVHMRVALSISLDRNSGE
jgi:hypothetical protein